MSILDLRRRLEPDLLKDPEITGVSHVGNRLRIYVEGSPEAFLKHIEGYRVEVVKTGPIKALALMNVPWFTPKTPLQLSRTQKWPPPIPGGVSIGHPSVTAGTHGTVLTIGGVRCGLSNDHVLAAASTTLTKRANIGDHIYQPGVYDGGTEADTVGELYWYQPLNENGNNLVDAALFRPSSPDLLGDDILDIGAVAGVSRIALDEVAQKSGRTTGVTQARVLDVEATIKVDYGLFGATFYNQIITDYMADGGDSGSALLDMNNNLVGLLFAGSEYVTVHNHISDVLAAIGGVAPPTGPARTPFPFILPPLVGALIGGFIK